MSQLQQLENTLLSSRKVADFLRNFSSTTWPRLLKACVILGMQEVERRVTGHTHDTVFEKAGKSSINLLYAKDVEDLVVRLEEELLKFKLGEKTKGKSGKASKGERDSRRFRASFAQNKSTENV